MTLLRDVEGAPEKEVTAAVADRRRPGRLEQVSPELIPMLRGADPAVAIEFEDIDQSAAARGLCVGLLMSAPIWAAIAYAGTWFLS